MELGQQLLHNLIGISWLFFEFVGVVVVIYTGIRGITDLIKHKDMRKGWMRTLAIGLNFLLISEVLKTVNMGSFHEFGMLAGVFILRALIAILIHWEMKTEI